MLKRWAFVVLAVGCCVVASALSCAGGVPVPVTAPAPAPDARPVIRVAASGDYAPFSERMGEGDYRGFDAAVARLFAAEAGFRLKWAPFRWPELLADLEGGRFDVAMSGVTVRPERSVAGRFSVPVTETGAVVLVRSGLALPGTGLAEQLAALDAPGHHIAVNAGGHLERVARAHFPNAQLRAIPNNAAVRAALQAGEVDAIVTDTLEAPGWMRGLEGVRLVGPFTRDRKAYLMPPDADALSAQLDDWLLRAERDGRLAELRVQWMGQGAGAPTALPLSSLLAASDERLALMPFVADWKRSRRRQIVDAEREVLVIDAGLRAVLRAAESIGGRSPNPRAVRAFYRAQIDAAVEIQQGVMAVPDTAGRESLDLAEKLRPALIRIGERMARLLVLVSGEARPSDLDRRVERALSRHELSPERVRAIANSIRGLDSTLQGGR